MELKELNPTEDVLIDALQRNLLNRNKDLSLFYKFLQVQPGSAMIGLDGKWGSGKTFSYRNPVQYII